MSVDPERRELLRRLFLSVGAWGAARVLPGCDDAIEPPSTVLVHSGAEPDTRLPAELRGREPLRYAGAADRPADGTAGTPTAGPDAPPTSGVAGAGPDMDARTDGGMALARDAGNAGSGSAPPPSVPPPQLPGGFWHDERLNMLLPEGFTARIVARSGVIPVMGSVYPWHEAPDGGAVFGLTNGGWIYVSNSEISGTGGVGALRFDADGTLHSAYPILQGTSRNCAGGATPWGTWLSCEEVARGMCWQCDPLGVEPATVHPALGIFNHEAAAVDLANRHVYLTEDRADGRLYRYTASRRQARGALDLDSGVLEVLELPGGTDEGTIRWLPVPDPSAATMETRLQVPSSKPFAGGEGIWLHAGVLFFTTKLDNRVWALDTERSELSVLYDARSHPTPTLSGVDNLTMSPSGHLVVAEDPGNMELVLLDAGGNPHTLLRILGQSGSELAGPAFTPAGDRLYFSSQRGQLNGQLGITYEVRGPFAELT